MKKMDLFFCLIIKHKIEILVKVMVTTVSGLLDVFEG